MCPADDDREENTRLSDADDQDEDNWMGPCLEAAALYPCAHPVPSLGLQAFSIHFLNFFH
jgi:hypothetical protein